MSEAAFYVSRRTFLKLLDTDAVLSIGDVVGLTKYLTTGYRANPRLRDRSATVSGSWSNGPETLDVGTNAPLLNGGKVFYLAGPGFHVPQSEDPFNHAIWDPATDTQTSLTLSEDLFRVGMATLPSGNILLAGPTLSYDIGPDNLDGKCHGLVRTSNAFSANDKVLVEWGGGNSTDQVWAKRRHSTDAPCGFDGTNTRQVDKFSTKSGYNSHTGSDSAGVWFKEV
jgi:hypothetical protein